MDAVVPSGGRGGEAPPGRPVGRRLRRVLLSVLAGLVVTAIALLVAWSIAIGPDAVRNLLTHGDTTVWDHLRYPGRDFEASAEAAPWSAAGAPLVSPTVDVDGVERDLAEVLEGSGTLGFVVVDRGGLAYEWYADDHGADRTSMLFSATKSILSLLIGAAIDDGLIASVEDPVTAYIPELRAAGFGAVTLEDLLRMDSGLDYVEDDNPFGLHVQFNFTTDLESGILALGLRARPEPEFRYKSGDNAVLGLVLDRALGDVSITEYFHDRLWDPLGSEAGGVWSTDREDGLERTWCCLAVTARDLARLGRLVLEDGRTGDTQVIPEAWLKASFEPAYGPDRWPAEYSGSPLVSYGYQWWLTDSGARLALGKDGQYLYVDPRRDVVVVRLGDGQGGISWLPVLAQVADTAG